MVRARGVSLVQPWGPIEVEAHDEGGDPKGPAAIALRVPLSTKDTLSGTSEHISRLQSTLWSSYSQQSYQNCC